MSKYPRGRYDTGEVKHVYFKKRKHFRRHKIRKLMWIANCIKQE